MAEQRLIDANALCEDWLENGENEYVYDTNSFLSSLDDAPTIDPETLPIVRQLREELTEVTAEREAAIEGLENYMVQDVINGNAPCEICANARETPCEGCGQKWRGPQKEATP